MSNQIRLGEVVQKWLDMNGQGDGAPVRWRTIIDVVKGPLVENITQAKTIYEYLKQESSIQQHIQSKSIRISLYSQLLELWRSIGCFVEATFCFTN